jgi:hypothetical protein
MKGYSFFSKLENSFSSRYPSVVMSCSRIYIFTTIFPAWQVSVCGYGADIVTIEDQKSEGSDFIRQDNH